MGNNVGLDFGTTYSVVSRLKNICVSDNLINDYDFEACDVGEGFSCFQDSIVVRKVRDGEELKTGRNARTSARGSSTFVYDGFKMLLSEPITVDGKLNPLLQKKNYDESFTPKYVTQIFLEDLFDTYFERNENSSDIIDKLVVGIPEIWNEENKAYACKDILGEILENDKRIKSYEFVSEPALACAFFVEKYKKKYNLDFEGNVLVIDYGGGTLDISLCDVSKKDKTTSISIPVKAGAGLNQEGATGKAGLAFIEKVVLLTLEDHGIAEDEARKENHFHTNKILVEDNLILNTKSDRKRLDNEKQKIKSVEEIFRINKNRDITKLDNELCEIEYKGEFYRVTYGILARAFNAVIKDVLQDKLQEIEDRMVEKGIISRTFETMDDGSKNKTVDYGKNFKIITIGGFSKFYLTEKAIRDFYKCSTLDNRIDDECCNGAERELAVSYGAALVANDIVSFRETIPYSYSIVTSESKVFKVVDIGTEIIENEIHFAKYPDGREVVFSGKKIETLRLSPGKGKIKDSEAKQDLSIPKDSVVKIGFSFSKTGAIKVHIFECINAAEGDYDTVSDSPHVIKLKDIYAVFGEFWDWEDEK